MLIATLTALFFLTSGGSGGWVKQVAALVETNVKDDGREIAAQAILDQITEELGRFDKGIMAGREKLAEVDANYASSASDYRAVLREMEQEWARTDRFVFESLLRLRDHVTREEWQVIFTKLNKKLEKAHWKAVKKGLGKR